MNYYQINTIRNNLVKNGETQTLINACKNNYPETIYYLLQYTLDINTINNLIKYITKDIIIFLYNKMRFNINMTDYNQWSIFTFACYNNNLELVQFLVNKVNVNIQDKIGMTPFMIACSNNNLDIVKYLYDKVNIYILDKQNKNALMVASYNGHLDVVKFLVENTNLDINSQSIFSMTPFLYAIYENRLDVVKYLYDKCNIYTKENDCLSLAYNFNNTEIIHFLLFNEIKKLNILLPDLIHLIINL